MHHASGKVRTTGRVANPHLRCILQGGIRGTGPCRNMQSTVVDQKRMKIFISYSRKDQVFANELVAGLQFGGFAPIIDKYDISAGEDWQARLARLIETSDTIVLVISPDFARSERCAWEIEKAEEFQKRVLPIVWRDTNEDLVPQRLKRLNYVYFDKPNSFGHSLSVLGAALNTDVEWIREHTRLNELASRWNRRARAEALLLGGDELTQATEWMRRQPEYAPEPTLLVRELITASELLRTYRESVERKRIEELTAALDAREAAQNEVAAAQRAKGRALDEADAANQELDKLTDRLSIFLLVAAILMIAAIVKLVPTLEAGVVFTVIAFWGSFALSAATLAGTMAALKRRSSLYWFCWTFLFPPLVLVLALIPRLKRVLR